MAPRRFFNPLMSFFIYQWKFRAGSMSASSSVSKSNAPLVWGSVSRPCLYDRLGINFFGDTEFNNCTSQMVLILLGEPVAGFTVVRLTPDPSFLTRDSVGRLNCCCSSTSFCNFATSSAVGALENRVSLPCVLAISLGASNTP